LYYCQLFLVPLSKSSCFSPLFSSLAKFSPDSPHHCPVCPFFLPWDQSFQVAFDFSISIPIAEHLQSGPGHFSRQCGSDPSFRPKRPPPSSYFSLLFLPPKRNQPLKPFFSPRLSPPNPPPKTHQLPPSFGEIVLVPSFPHLQTNPPLITPFAFRNPSTIVNRFLPPPE